tara:strand:+ start:2785 stop:4002 length:1218 start_codon:yes stop_codon:yes gene_type:complete
MNNIDVVVIGAGPSGTVAASILQKEGLNTLILEKQKFPRFVIGESLLPRCMDNLDKAGFLPALENAGFQKKNGAKFIQGEASCEFDFSIQYTKGWSWTWQVQRSKFDHILAEEVVKKGAQLEYNATVTAVEFHDDDTATTTYTNADGETCKVNSRFIIDASGYGRVLPRLLDLDKPSDFPNRSSIFCHVKPKEILNQEERKQIIILSIAEDIWGWIIPFSNDTSSVGIVGNPESIQRFEGDKVAQMKQWIESVPALKERFDGAEILFEPKSITGYSISTSQFYGKSYVLTGNSAEFLDPIFSSGITFATESGVKAAELVIRELAGEEVNWHSEYTEYIQQGVAVFRSFIKYWYDGNLQKIFFTKEENDQLKKQICSILAGYVWDTSNPLAIKHERAIPTLAKILD